MTVTEASTSANGRNVSAARNRRNWHEAQIAAARGWLRRLWRILAWIVAEAKQLPEPDRERLMNRLTGLALELNEGRRLS